MKQIYTLVIAAACSISTIAQGTWTQKANFGGMARYRAVGFSIGTKGYIGTGFSMSPNIMYQDFWEWDSQTNVWTQKADCGGICTDTITGLPDNGRNGAVGFSIGNKGYIGTGRNNCSGYLKDFWEYDPSTNTWTQKANFGGTGRQEAEGFSIGNKGYIGIGYEYAAQANDFWEYDPTNDTWTQKAASAGVGRNETVGFSIGTKGYFGTGHDGTAPRKDFWEWDQATNTWTQKANFGGTVRYMAVGFAIGNKGYVGTGYDGGSGYSDDFWEWNQATNTWTQIANYGGDAPICAVAFTIGNKGYVGTGWGYNSGVTKEFWEFYDLNLSAVMVGSPICNNQCTGTASVSVSGGTPPYTYLWNTIPMQTTSTATGLCAGTNTVTVSDGIGSATTTVTITTLPSPAAPSICMVTVDTVSENNIIMWDKTSFPQTDSFIVYREITTNNYQPIGVVPYDSLSMFIDTVRAKYFPYTGDPNTGTYRYKIAVHDSCGNNSTMSLYHNTIYTTNNSGTFSWNYYTIENTANPVSGYILKRDDFSNGNWHAVAGVSGTQQTVTDPQYSAYQNTASWRIETQWSISCVPTRINQNGFVNFNASISNVYKGAFVNVNSFENDLYISISPNPTSGVCRLTLPCLPLTPSCRGGIVEVYSVLGEKIYSAPLLKGGDGGGLLDLSSAPSGIYFLQLKTSEGTAVKKIIKE